jgi:hypothetical protein
MPSSILLHYFGSKIAYKPTATFVHERIGDIDS